MPRLIVSSGKEEGMIFQLSPRVTSIGRSASNAIQIIDKRISRNHAEIIYSDGHYIFRDLSSKNGSKVNSNPIKKAVVLQHGDVVQSGDTLLTFEMEEYSVNHAPTAVRLVDDEEPAMTRERVTADDAPGAKKLPGSITDADGVRSDQQLEILYQVADAIRSIFDINELLCTLMDIIFNVMEPDRGTILTKDRQTGVLVPRLTRKTVDDTGDLVISYTIVDCAIRDKAGLLTSDAMQDARFADSESIVQEDIRSAICTPLIYRDEVLGVIYIDTTSRPDAYGKSELALLMGISNQAALAISNTELIQQVFLQKRLEREMEIARDIQMNLLPQVYPDAPGFEFSAMSLPAKHVGGDYYDFIPVGPNRIGLIIADVSGKGVPAAIVLSTMRTALKLLLEKSGDDVSLVMTQLNRIICQDTTAEMFVTMVIGVLDVVEHTFEYCNAGHCSPVLLMPDGDIVELESNSSVVGIVEQVDFEQQSVILTPGTMLAMTTDGVTDTMNATGDIFGKKAFLDFVRKNRNLPVRDFRDALYKRLLIHKQNAEQFDDMTIVVIKASEE